MSAPAGIEESFPFDISIVGLGIVGVHQITREAEGVIRQSRHCLLADPGFGVLSFLQSICPKVTCLTSFYEPGKSRLPTYHRMAAAVIDGALVEAPVCFATYGHPLVYCYPTTLIKRAAAVLDLRVEIFPGISSLDTLLVDLGVDVGLEGLQMYEATDLLLCRKPIHKEIPCILWQAHVVADPMYQTERRLVEEFLPLQDYLLEFYPPEHPVTLVLSKTFPLVESLVETFSLGTLAQRLADGPQIGNLYIPPLRRAEVKDLGLLSKMQTSRP